MGQVKRVLPSKPIATKISTSGTTLSISVGKNKNGKC